MLATCNTATIVPHSKGDGLGSRPCIRFRLFMDHLADHVGSVPVWTEEVGALHLSVLKQSYGHKSSNSEAHPLDFRVITLFDFALLRIKASKGLKPLFNNKVQLQAHGHVVFSSFKVSTRNMGILVSISTTASIPYARENGVSPVAFQAVVM